MCVLIRRLTVIVALTVFTSPLARAISLIDDGSALAAARTNVSMALRQVAGDLAVAKAKAGGASTEQMARAESQARTDASVQAAAFVAQLENFLKGKAVNEVASLTGQEGAARTLVLPRTNSSELLVVAAVIPPKGNGPIAICVQQYWQVAGSWNLTEKGGMVPRPIIPNQEGSNLAPCAATVVAARTEINSALANNAGPSGTKGLMQIEAEQRLGQPVLAFECGRSSCFPWSCKEAARLLIGGGGRAEAVWVENGKEAINFSGLVARTGSSWKIALVDYGIDLKVNLYALYRINEDWSAVREMASPGDDSEIQDKIPRESLSLEEKFSHLQARMDYWRIRQESIGAGKTKYSRTENYQCRQLK